jgi:hypothetical protein
LDTVVLSDVAWSSAPPERPPCDEPLELVKPCELLEPLETSEPQPATASRPTTASATATITRRGPMGTHNRRVEQQRSGLWPGPAWRTARDHTVWVSRKRWLRGAYVTRDYGRSAMMSRAR